MLPKLLSKLTGKRIATLREASIRVIDDTKIEVHWKTARTRGHLDNLWLIDLDDDVQAMIDSLADSADVCTHEYEEWQRVGRYNCEVDVIEHCFNCAPVTHEEEPEPVYISWMDNPKYYRCAGY